MKDAKNSDGDYVKFLGRAGMIYKNKISKYFIDSEMLVDSKYYLAIFSDSVRYFDDKNRNVYIPEKDKAVIVKDIVILLQESGKNVLVK